MPFRDPVAVFSSARIFSMASFSMAVGCAPEAVYFSLIRKSEPPVGRVVLIYTIIAYALLFDA
jgi:hypothetical protein